MHMHMHMHTAPRSPRTAHRTHTLACTCTCIQHTAHAHTHAHAHAHEYSTARAHSPLSKTQQVRAAGKFDHALFDRYNHALVRLSDPHVNQIYSEFMLVYVEEADEDTLQRLGCALHVD